jgi:3-oxosteroid 1-dehydrogenase
MADTAGVEGQAGFDEQFDFVVVGSGGGSMCAGLVMRDAGKSVLVLEKTEFLGGTTARSGGDMWIPNNSVQKRDGVEDSDERSDLYLDSIVGDDPTALGATRERRRTYVREAPRMLDFIIAQGVKITRPKWRPDYYDDAPGGHAQGRTVSPMLFDINKLGPWKAKLRPGMLPFPVKLTEGFLIANKKQSWRGKLAYGRVAFRVIWTKIAGKHLATAGQALQGQMLYAAIRTGVTLRTESPVTSLIEEDGAITGVVTVKDGRPWRVGARLGVLVNAGGFAHNQRMRDQYAPGTRNEWSMAAEGDTGEMIEEMARHGAALSQMEERVGFQVSMAPGAEAHWMKPGMQNVTAAPHAILVDQSGVRYQNEGGSYMAFCKGMLERNKTVPAVPSWAILDNQYLAKYMLNGTMAGTKKPQAWFDSGYMRKADTVEDLARQLKIDPAALKGTVDRFNGFVEANNDADFHRGARTYDGWLGDFTHKPSMTLGKISQAPFYALPVVPGDVGTYGGAVTDVHARVLRADGSVIHGLYATGVSSASVMGRFYPGAGCSVGPSLTWGYVAAKHAAARENEPVTPAKPGRGRRQAA